MAGRDNKGSWVSGPFAAAGSRTLVNPGECLCNVCMTPHSAVTQPVVGEHDHAVRACQCSSPRMCSVAQQEVQARFIRGHHTSLV